MSAFDQGAKAAAEIPRQCTCHPNDNPPKPCQKKYALTECQRAARDQSIGGVLDHWDGLPNDLVSQLEEEVPAFVAAMRGLNRVIEEG